jgi:YD repeat-containing protein
MRRTRILFVAVLLTSVLRASAQQHPNVERGFAADKVYQFGGIDSVNLFNGGVTLTIPLGQTYPVGGSLSYQWLLVYNSKVWDYDITYNAEVQGDPEITEAIPVRESNAGLGWRVSQGELWDTDHIVGQTSLMTYLGADGAQHGFHFTMHSTDEVPSCNYEACPTLYTRDGSYLRMRLTAGARYVDFPDGTVQKFVADGTGWRFAETADPFGNYLRMEPTTISATPCPSSTTTRAEKYTDSTGRASYLCYAPRTYDGVETPMVERLIVPVFDGATATWILGYTPENVTRGCGHELAGGTAALNLPLLTSLQVPDGTQYGASYFLNDLTNQTCRQGSISALQLPLGGTISWEWQKYNVASADGEDCTPTHIDRTVGIARKTINDGVTSQSWTYQPLQEESTQTETCYRTNPLTEQLWSWTRISPRSQLKTVVTTPLLDQEWHYFSIWPRIPYPYTQNGAYGADGYEYGLPFTRQFATPLGINQGENVFLSRQYLDCDSGGAGCIVKRSEYTRYERDPLGNTGSYGGSVLNRNRRPAAAQTIFNSDSNKWIASRSTIFDGLGHYRETTVGSNFGDATRTATRSYNERHASVSDSGPNVGTFGVNFSMPPSTGPWILETFTKDTLRENGQERTTLYCFDPANGFLKRKRTLARTSLSSTDLIYHLTADDTTGNVVREEWFGGDFLPDVTSLQNYKLCNAGAYPLQYRVDKTWNHGALASSTYWDPATNQALLFSSIDNTIDPHTGLPSQMRDTAGVATLLGYDALSRIVHIRPTGAASTEYLYKRAGELASGSPPTVLIDQHPVGNPTGTALTQAKVEYDKLGRVGSELRKMPAGWVKQITKYDALGRRKSLSEWALSPAEPAFHTYFAYDMFGRTTQVTAQDSTAQDSRVSTFDYTGGGVRELTRTTQVATSASATTSVAHKEEFDGKGRLIKVTEPSGATSATAPVGSNVITAYEYGLGDELRKVTTYGSEAVQQVREFSYDARGLLMSEAHPESGITTYTYDARGHARTKIQGDAYSIFDTFHDYDPAERLVKVSYRHPYYNPANPWDPSFRPLKEFVYGPANVGNNMLRGKLAQAVRYNYAPYSALLQSQESHPLYRVFDTYGYDDGAGRRTVLTTRITKQDTPFYSTEDTVRTITQRIEYSDLGLPKKITYPTCTYCGVPPNGMPSVDIQPTYTDGLLTTIPGYVSGITYHPSGLVHTVTRNNLMIDTVAADPHGMARPRSYQFSGWSDCGTPPSVVTPPANQTIASGQTATLSVTVSGTIPFSYQWYEGAYGVGTPIPGATQSSFTTPTLTTTKQYWVKVANVCRSVETAAATITVSSCANVVITADPQSKTAAAGTVHTLFVVAEGSGTLSYQWYRGDAGVTTTPVGTNATQYTTPAINQTTKYWVKVTNTCNGSSNSVNSAVATITIPLPAPANLTATMSPPTSITISWTAVPGAHHYQLERRSNGVDFQVINPNVQAISIVDSGRTANTTYVYRILALDANGLSASAYSAHNLATIMTFSSVVANQTLIDDAHWHELLAAVNAVRVAVGWAGVTWTQVLPPGTPIPAAGAPILGRHAMALRSEFDRALQALGVPISPYTDSTLSIIRAIHVRELQERAQ